MRTTISLDDRLLAQLKRRATESGTSVSKVVEQAVRLFVRTPRTPRPDDSFELVTFGAGGPFSRYDIDTMAELIDAEDRARFSVRR